MKFPGLRSVFASGLLTGMVSFGMASVSQAETRLDEIVVRAARSGKFSSNASVTVLTKEDLESEKSSTLTQVLERIVGLDVAMSGGAGQSSAVFIRGSKSEHTLVLIDGIEANDPTSTTRYFDFSSLTVENFERIEIYRGSRSTRFGADAIGGVINLVTKKGAGSLKSEAGIELGSYDTRRFNGSMFQGTDRFHSSFGISRLAARSFSAANAGADDEADGFSRTSLSSRFGWDFSGRSNLDVTLRLILGETSLDYSGGAAGDDPNYESKARQILAGATYASSAFNEKLTSSIGVYFHSARRQYDNDPDLGRTENYHELFQSENLKLETNHSYAFTEDSHLELTVQYRQEEGESDRRLNTVQTNLSRRRQAVLGETLIYDLHTAGFTFEAGVRHDSVSTTGDELINSSLGVRYDWVDLGTSLQVNYGTGFKNPSLFQLYSNFGMQSLKSERSTSYDVSLEQKIGSNAFFTFTYFRNSYSNLIDFDIAASKYANISDARSEGGEFQITLLPTSTVILRFGLKTLHTRDEKTGLDLLRRPRLSRSALLEWRENRWRATLGYRRVGDRDDLDPVAFTRIRMPEYDVLEASASYAFAGNFEGAMRFENLMHRSYQDVAGYRTSGRAIFVGGTARF